MLNLLYDAVIIIVVVYSFKEFFLVTNGFYTPKKKRVIKIISFHNFSVSHGVIERSWIVLCLYATLAKRRSGYCM